MVRASPWEPAIRLCGGDTNMGMLLHQLEFFHDKTKHVNKDGNPVTIRTYAELAEEFGWTERKAKSTVTKLREAGIVEVTHGPHPTMRRVLRCMHICLIKQTKSVPLNGPNSADSLYLTVNEKVNEETAVPTTLEFFGKSISQEDFPGSMPKSAGTLYALWKDCLSEAYPGELVPSWGKGRMKFAKALISKHPWEPLLEALRRVLLDWPGFRLWLSEHSEVKCKADRPELLFLLKHSDLMMQFSRRLENTAGDAEPWIEDYTG